MASLSIIEHTGAIGVKKMQSMGTPPGGGGGGGWSWGVGGGGGGVELIYFRTRPKVNK